MNWLTPRMLQQRCRHRRWSLPIYGLRWCFTCGATGKFVNLRETR